MPCNMGISARHVYTQRHLPLFQYADPLAMCVVLVCITTMHGLKMVSG